MGEKRKKIAVNTRFLIQDKLEGIGRFTYEVLQRIVRSHPEVDFYFLFDRMPDESFLFADNVTPVVVFPPARHPLLWYYWFEYKVPKFLAQVKPDLFFSTDGYLSLKTNTKTLMVVHDLAFEHFPNHVDFLTRKYYTYFTPKYVERADKIITVSEYTKQDIISLYGTNTDKIDVVYNGCSASYRRLNDIEKKEIQANYTEGNEFFIYAGSIHPRKNVGNLFRAFDAFKTKTNSPTKLVIAGRKAWKFSEIFEAYENMQHKADVIFTGHIPPEELSKLVGAAKAMVYVSLFEGFGLPVAEAMQAGTPVITSNTSSMKEIAEGAALVVNPLEISEISMAMEKLDTESILREELIQKGLTRSLDFSWDISAQKIWKEIEQLI